MAFCRPKVPAPTLPSPAQGLASSRRGRRRLWFHGLRALRAVTRTLMRELFWFRLGMHPCRRCQDSESPPHWFGVGLHVGYAGCQGGRGENG